MKETMKETLTLNSKEQRRLMVLNKVIGGELTAREGAGLLGLSLRQVRRVLAAYRKEGAKALAHGNRGRIPHNVLSQPVRAQVIELAQTKYKGCNQQHLSELLAEQEGISISRSSIRRTLLSQGIRSPRKRRTPKHRSRRDRYPQEGMLLQVDASDHDWLQGRGPRLVLVASIDDATGQVPGAEFRLQEDAHGYMLVMRQVVLTHGRPLAVYHDRHSIFEQTPRRMVEWSIEEQLRREREPTQFARVLEELEIASISAHSPQAKGRVERLFGTLQDRLVVELRLAGAATLEEANCVLRAYLPRFNARFAIPPAQEGKAYRPLAANCDPDTIFCMKYSRVVASDNTVRLGEHRLQLLPSTHRLSYARTRVEVHERLDGSLAVYYQGECLAHKPAPPEAPVLRARRGRRGLRADVQGRSYGSYEVRQPLEGELAGPPKAVSKPVPDHPWRRFSLQKG
jgi:transposase